MISQLSDIPSASASSAVDVSTICIAVTEARVAVGVDSRLAMSRMFAFVRLLKMSALASDAVAAVVAPFSCKVIVLSRPEVDLM